MYFLNSAHTPVDFVGSEVDLHFSTLQGVLQIFLEFFFLGSATYNFKKNYIPSRDLHRLDARGWSFHAGPKTGRTN
jgi:hypothetical protein